jgi:hypothetical protein
LGQKKIKLRLEVGEQGAEVPSSHRSIDGIVSRQALADHREALECFEKDLKILIRGLPLASCCQLLGGQ